jgi:hypothetical protein
MSAQTMPVTLSLPEPLYRQFQQAAQAAKRRLEDVLLQTIAGNVPPSVEDVPSEIRAELQALQWLDTKMLWEVARSRISPAQQARHEYLLDQNQRGTISPAEREELDRLGEMADRLTVKKAYAYALLRWRGFPLPTLEAMEAQL